MRHPARTTGTLYKFKRYLDTVTKTSVTSPAPCEGVELLYPEKHIRRVEPRILGRAPLDPNMKLRMQIHIDEPNMYLGRMQNARLFFGNHGFCWSHEPYIIHNDIFYYDLMRGHIAESSLTEEERDSGDVYLDTENRTTRYLEGTHTLLSWSAASGNNHSHWMLQTLPRIYFLLQSGLKSKIIVNNFIQPYQIEMLGYAGIPEGDIVIATPDEILACEDLFVPHPVGGGLIGFVMPGWMEVLNLIASRALKEIKPEKYPSRIYVSRLERLSINCARRFLSEPLIEEVAKDNGFTVITPGKISFLEELAWFSQATEIMGPLGAGLYNAVFSPPESKILSLTGDMFWEPWVEHIAHERKMQSGYVFGETIVSDDTSGGGGHWGMDSNWILYTSSVKSAIKEFF